MQEISTQILYLQMEPISFEATFHVDSVHKNITVCTKFYKGKDCLMSLHDFGDYMDHYFTLFV